MVEKCDLFIAHTVHERGGAWTAYTWSKSKNISRKFKKPPNGRQTDNKVIDFIAQQNTKYYLSRVKLYHTKGQKSIPCGTLFRQFFS